MRLELFGDEIESIRTFDITTQRSIGSVGQAVILPAREVVLHRPFFDDYVPNLERAEQETGVDLTEFKDQLELGTTVLDGIEMVMSILYGADDGLFTYLREDALLYSEESDDLDAELIKAFGPSRRDWERHADRATHLPLTLLTRDGDWLHDQLSNRGRLRPAPLGEVDAAVRFGASEPRVVQGELAILRQEISRLDEESYDIHILSETKGQTSRLQEIFSDWSDAITFGLGALSRGFVFPAAKVAILNDHEIFSRQKNRYRYRRFRAAKPIGSFDAMQRGDYVVHVDHGIGRYTGLRRLTISNRDHDCLEVCYQGQDKLFVPVEQLDLLRRYSSTEGDMPLLSKLGSSAWEKLKERTKEEIFKMAGELILLYAERKSLPGMKFSADTPMLRELEAAFPFTETPDQLRTVEEVKRDMEHGRDEVRVMTVHGAKGLEAPIVFLPDTCTTASAASYGSASAWKMAAAER